MLAGVILGTHPRSWPRLGSTGHMLICHLHSDPGPDGQGAPTDVLRGAGIRWASRCLPPPPASGLLGESLVKNQLGNGSWLDIYSPRWCRCSFS